MKRNNLNKNPLVSIVMPAYNAEKFVGEAIESMLAQTYPYFELIVVDDKSSDKTYSVLHKYARKDKRVILLRNNTNLKLSKTLNRGISLAKGKYIARMDADDWSYPDRLKKQVSYMEQHPEVGIIGGVMEIINMNGEKIGERRYPLEDYQIRKKMFRFSPFSHPLIMIRKSALDRAGYYNDEFNPAEDYELYFRIGEYAKFANLTDTLLKYRIVPKSMTTGNTKNMELKTLAIRKKYSHTSLYNQGIMDRLYSLTHKASLYLLPSPYRMWLFHFLRNSSILR